MNETDAPNLELRPFQSEAVEHFFRAGGPAHLLRAPLGTGKGVTASAIVVEALRRGASAVAVLAARNVVAQGIAWRAAGFGLTPFELHRAVAMSTSASPAPRWPERVLTFGSLRQAAREPIAVALQARRWDLLVADVSGASDTDVEELRRLLAALRVDRLLALEDRRPMPSQWSWLGMAPLAFDVPDTPDAASPSLNFSVIEYERSAAEMDLLERAQRLAIEFRNLGVRVRTRLPAAAVSSPVAAQAEAWTAADSLRQFRNRLAHGLPGQPEEKASRAPRADDLPRLEHLRDELTRFAEDVDLLELDSKWDAFISALRDRGHSQTVVFCDFAETAVYVADRLQASGIEAASLDGPAALAAVDERPDVVLVSREDQLLGLELRHARVAFNYDLPSSQRRAHIRWSRLDWTHLDPPTEMVTLLDRRNASPTERMAFVQLRYMVGDG